MSFNFAVIISSVTIAVITAFILQAFIFFHQRNKFAYYIQKESDILKIAVDFGHCTSGQDRGANGYLNEETVDREYGAAVIKGLQKLGHTVINVTPVQQNLTLAQSLTYRVNAANAAKADLFLCLHVNAFQTDKAQGCEVEYISASGKAYADRICTEISGQLGYINRGSQKRPNLYVLKYTNMIAVLVEPFFCSTKSDCSKYNAEKLAKAIIKGVTGKDVSFDTPAPIAQKPKPKVFDISMPEGENITVFKGGIGYVETIKDEGRVIVHLDRYTYISMKNEGQESHIDICTRQGNKRLM